MCGLNASIDGPDAGEVVVDAEHAATSWPRLPQRLDDVVLHLPLGLEDVDAGGVLRRHEMVVHERETRSLLHKEQAVPPLCR